MRERHRRTALNLFTYDNGCDFARQVAGPGCPKSTKDKLTAIYRRK